MSWSIHGVHLPSPRCYVERITGASFQSFHVTGCKATLTAFVWVPVSPHRWTRAKEHPNRSEDDGSPHRSPRVSPSKAQIQTTKHTTWWVHLSHPLALLPFSITFHLPVQNTPRRLLHRVLPHKVLLQRLVRFGRGLQQSEGGFLRLYINIYIYKYDGVSGYEDRPLGGGFRKCWAFFSIERLGC